MKRWFGAKAPASGTNGLLSAAEEPHALAEAMASAMLMMNDEIDVAEEQLSHGTSPFHKLGRAYALFFRAILGFEKDVMEQASLRLAEAEESATEHQKRAIRDPSSAHQSAIYPPGAEYALCHAEAQLMSAVVAVLNESLTESLKGFYKLRKAFWTLHDLSEAEKKYLSAHHSTTSSSATSVVASTSTTSSTVTPNLVSSSTPAKKWGTHTPAINDGNDDDDDDFVDASEEVIQNSTAAAGLHDGSHPPDHEFDNLTLHGANEVSSDHEDRSDFTSGSIKEEQVDFRSITSDPIDLYIHSGTGMMYGLMQLILSMIPPAFSRLLSLFSFRGDRETGFRMLWSASRFKKDINGAMAGLFTLAFHNATIAYCDIITEDALPRERLKALLFDMRKLYPRSKLWLLEEARMLSADRQLEQSVDMMDQDKTETLRQIEALRMFERSLNCMYLHRYEECAEGFMECVKLNNWSHGLYYYIAGACYVELYRTYKASDPARAAGYAEKADLHLHKVPEHTGKKRLMARQLPLDTFVLRKITKWDHRAKLWKCDFVDAIGVSPTEEMSYFWSGYRRMNPAQLQDSLKRLAWFDDPTSNQNFLRESVDEKTILALLKATCFRFLGEIQSAQAMLQENVLSHNLQQLKACDHPDTWPLPIAHYEMAVCLWEEAGRENGDKTLLRRCSEEIATIESWESFDLEARVGMKVTTARATLKKLGI